MPFNLSTILIFLFCLKPSNWAAILFSAAGMARGKPHPDIFLHAAREMGAEPGSCAVVEDSPVGVQTGIAAGMTVFGYAALTDAHALSAAGAHVFTHMQELPTLLERGLC